MSLCNKTEEARTLLKSGNFLKALAIVKTFRLGFSKEEKRSIQIACESLSGHEQFYRSLDIDTDKEIERARRLLTDKYFV